MEAGLGFDTDEERAFWNRRKRVADSDDTVVMMKIDTVAAIREANG